MSVAESDSALQLVILISGRGSNALAILDAIDQNRLAAKLEVRAVVADCSIDRPAAGLAKAKDRGIDTAQLDPKSFANKASFEQALTEVLQSFNPDLIVLAGFMRVLSASFVEQFADQIVNIHPSLLPNYRGLNTHQRALDAGDQRHGVSVHWVTAELDGGPVITQAKINVQKGDTAESLAARVLTQEHRLYPATLALLAQNRVSTSDETKYQSSKAHSPKPCLLDRDFDDSGRRLPATQSAPGQHAE